MVIRDVNKSLRKIVARNYGTSETAIPYESPTNLYGDVCRSGFPSSARKNNDFL